MGYKDVNIPDGKEPSEYSYHERRSELLGFAIEAGHPDMLSRKRFAERYDVDPSTITRDIQALGDEIHEDLSSDAELITSVIYRKAVREKMDQGDFVEAVQIVESWNEWLEDRGQQEKVPDRMEMDLDASVESTERKALIGVDLGAFQGVNTDQMVGLDLDEEMLEDDGEALEDGVDVPLTNGDGGEDDE